MKVELTDALLNAIDFRLEDLHTNLPGIVQKYYPATQTADIQPAIKKKYLIDGEIQILDNPVITNVPIAWQGGGNSSLTFNLEPGDAVLLCYCERSLERWLSAGGTTENGINRKFDIKDAIAIPRIKTLNNPLSQESGVTAWKNSQLGIKLYNNNKLWIGNDQVELLDWLDRLVDEIKSITVEGKPIDNIAAFTTLQTELSELKT